MKYEIHIGEVLELSEGIKEIPKTKIVITEKQKEILEMFADTKKDKDLNIIYKINDCEFTIQLYFNTKDLLDE